MRGAASSTPSRPPTAWRRPTSALAATSCPPSARGRSRRSSRPHAFDAELPAVERGAPSADDARAAMVLGWMQHLGPTDAPALAGAARPVARRGERHAAAPRRQRRDPSRTLHRSRRGGPEEWCDRRLLARIHRLTVGRLRREIEPVTAAAFMHWLLRWQHAAPGTGLIGERGLLQAIGQLQGFEAPASAWERQILARRMTTYEPEMLDRLCLTGAVGWGRLSPHPATLEGAAERSRRVVPTSVGADHVLRARRRRLDGREAGFHGRRRARAQSVGARRARHAADARRLVLPRHRPRERAAEVRGGDRPVGTRGGGARDRGRLRQPARPLDPKRRAGQGRGRASRPRHSAGRWALLHPPQTSATADAKAAASRRPAGCC